MGERRLNKRGRKLVQRIVISTCLIIAVVGVGIKHPEYVDKILEKVKIIQQDDSQTEQDNEVKSTISTERQSDLEDEQVKDSESSVSTTESQKEEENSQIFSEITEEDAVKIRGYCNSFAGYTAAIMANGGLETQPGSYFYENGLDVSIGIEDDDDVIIEAFKNDEIDFFFMTVNKMSWVCKELQDAGKDVVIPYITDTSTGGDGIVANGNYNSIEDLKDAQIAMARDSVSEAMMLWLFNAVSRIGEDAALSVLESYDSTIEIESDVDLNAVLSNFKLYDSTQEAVEAFVKGEAGAVATWDLTTALNAEGSHLLFSTEDAEYLIIDALVVNKKFATENPDVITSLIDGCISVVNDINSVKNEEELKESYDIIRESVPDFSSYDDATISSLIEDSKLLGYNKNLEAIEIATDIYTDFCTVWSKIGFETNPEYVEELFDSTYLEKLSNKWENNETVSKKENVTATEEVIDKKALVSKTAHVLFEPNSAEFSTEYEEESKAMLDEFVKIAKILNRMVIKLEGNVSLTPGNKSNAFDYELSRMRAEHVKEYMVEHGIEPERIIIQANGGDCPITTNETPEGRVLNRNCIVSFYQGETEN